jgi:hypothetical protein
MTAEVIVEIYRTNENVEEHTFTSSVVITYTNGVAFIQALSSTMTLSCWKEIKSYLEGNPRVIRAEYLRKGKLKVLTR